MVLENTDYFFGPGSFFLSRELVLNKDGLGGITDGLAVDIANRQWFIMNATLARHNVWNHIVPQVIKQLVTAERSTTKQLIIELIIQRLREDKNIMKKFNDDGFGKENEGVFLNDIRNVLGEIFCKSPVIGMPIDSVSNDLKDWSETLKAKVKLYEVKKYTECDNSENIIYHIPEEENQTGLKSAESKDKHSKNTETGKTGKDNLKAREIYLTKS
ncbi:pyruvate ferredoxin oxidoreductase and related 2-oxoacid:ferredoxin oxidoreductase, gamma subunit [Candidatus Scalindua japonica]|uniref:Pyruvate ferredoxin oxidoreductase and related 2-oxoacid:ferredoxin oxidoreductase, gamma subunit n=2 Tax=Candidatus Scalindua japonica TaxID=1284222 RepID=A0A286TVP3_9BACT|nr:pyruvate ferredoxin oxidoreductase and related 2-oxoacid:ferredoxin oxidoreductase, gamma subunit [Candidatus Scalindua japonica]